MLDVTDSTPDLQNPGLIGVYGSTTGNRWVRFRDLEAKPLFRGTLIMVR